MTDNDIHLDDSCRPEMKVEPYDGKGSRGGGNHVMSGEPLFKCPKYGLTAQSYCYSCSNFNPTKKDKHGNLGECDLYPGARDRVVAQIARNQPKRVTGKLTREELQKMGVRNINDEIDERIRAKDLAPSPRKLNTGFTGRRMKTPTLGNDKREWQKAVKGRNLNAVERAFGKSKKKLGEEK